MNPHSKLNRRISLQAPLRKDKLRISNAIIGEIVTFQTKLFHSRILTLNNAYMSDPPHERDAKIINDWVYMSSNLCYLISSYDFELIEEVLLQSFTMFYLIMKFKLSIINSSLCTVEDYNNIKILTQKMSSFLTISQYSLYFVQIKQLVDKAKLSTIEETTPKYNRRSLDPRFLPGSSPSSNELYPNDDTDDEEYLANPVHLSDSNSTSSDESFTIPAVDVESLSAFHNKLLILNINDKKLHSSSKSILTIPPQYVSNAQYITSYIVPYLQKENKIVIFSSNETISHLEIDLYTLLISLHFSNIYWLKGGYKSFEKYYITTHRTSPPPPIPKAEPLIPISAISQPSISNSSLISEQNSIQGQLQYQLHKSTVPRPLSVPPIPKPTALYQLSRLDYKPLVTLRNMGSTCYINSMIQCLFSIKKFREFFINDEALKKYLFDLNNPKNIRLTSGFHELFAQFYDKSPHNSLPPIIDMTRFLSIIAKLNPHYHIPNEQQDTSQFLYYIIDQLHKELKFDFHKAESLHIIPTSNTSTTARYNDWLVKSYESEGFSYIQNLFNIKEEVKMKCQRCGYESVRYETSIMVYLTIKNKKTTLEEIIKKNFLPEEMSSALGNAWDCDGCNKAEKELEVLQGKLEKEHDIHVAQHRIKELNEREKERERERSRTRLKFFKIPLSNKREGTPHSHSENELELYPYTIPLNEFEKSEYNRLADIFTRERVAYRTVEFVDLPNVLVFCLSLFNPSQQDAKVNIKDLKFPEVLNVDMKGCEKTYRLNSWIDHWGVSIDSGHYTATATYNESQWITFDDDRLNGPMKKVGNYVQDNNVYLLFYEAV